MCELISQQVRLHECLIAKRKEKEKKKNPHIFRGKNKTQGCFCKLRQPTFQKQEHCSQILREINRLKTLKTKRISTNKNHESNLYRNVTFSLDMIKLTVIKDVYLSSKEKVHFLIQIQDGFTWAEWHGEEVGKFPLTLSSLAFSAGLLFVRLVIGPGL